MRARTVCALAALARAQAPSWLGFRPSAATPGTVELLDLNDDATVNKVLGALALGKGEVPWADAVRCLPGPPAFCLLATQEQGPVPSRASRAARAKRMRNA